MQNQQSPKLKQFTDELNELLKKYQYQMTPQLNFNKNGITPVLLVIDIVPPKKVEPDLTKKDNTK